MKFTEPHPSGNKVHGHILYNSKRIYFKREKSH